MKSRKTIASLICIAVFVGVTASAGPAQDLHEKVAEGHGIRVILTYREGDFFEPFFKFTNLKIYRNGLLADAGPAQLIGSTPQGLRIRIVNLDDRGDPEIVIEAFSGGMHCCVESAIYGYDRSARTYRALNYGWGSEGFNLKPAGSGNGYEFLSADKRFEYYFASFAESGMPILICKYEPFKLVNTTGEYPDLLRRDAAHFWGLAKATREEPDSSALGFLAAWAADKYRLGEGSEAMSAIRGSGLNGVSETYLARLRAFLVSDGYASQKPQVCPQGD